MHSNSHAVSAQRCVLHAFCGVLSLSFRALAVAAAFGAAVAATAADQPQWGEQYSRNMVSAERDLPSRFDPDSGENIRWVAELGTECYSTPVVASGKVLIGTNNEKPRNPRHDGDRGVMMCFDERDGRFLWQLVVPKLAGDVFLDWPKAGICSPATVEGNYAYTLTNRDEVVCLDLDGLADGNDGPYQDEARHAAPADMPPVELTETDADIVWLVDLRQAVGVRPHDSTHSSILIDGPLLYLNTSNGLNSKHQGVERPEAPSLVVIDKQSGRIVAADDEKIGPRIFHCTWSSPALGVVAGRRLVFFGGGDGIVYAFDALKGAEATAEGRKLTRVWRFDGDPESPKEDVHQYIRNRRMSPSTIQSIPVFHGDRVYVTMGGDIWWGKHEAWLKVIDARGEGDKTSGGLIWSYPLDRHCCSTPAIYGGMVFVADCGGKVHCVDAETGKPFWVHDAGGEIWGSTLVADGKVYIGTRRGLLLVFAAAREKSILASVKVDSGIAGSPVAANGTVYVPSMTRLYAVGGDKSIRRVKPAE